MGWLGLLSTVAGSGVGVPMLRSCVRGQPQHCTVPFRRGFVLLLSICPQCLGATRKDVLETFTEVPSQWISKHWSRCVSSQAPHKPQPSGSWWDIAVTPLLQARHEACGSVQVCHTRPDALMGILGSAFLTVTTLGHNCVFSYCPCSMEFFSLFTTSSKRDLCLPT